MDGSSKGFRESDLLDFIRGNDKRGICFGRWPDNILESYLRYTSTIGSLYLVKKGGKLVALGIARRINEDDLDRHWIPQDEKGDTLDISDVICSERKAVETLVDEFTSRHPAWRECKLWVTRHGKRKQLKPEMIERLAA
jgi:hypothetical protein|tara:strand:+ start:239 stop:655 length:417 start_codon:yes stop_codon:yes gene_type:complete